MAQIAEELFLLLVDNASGDPGLDDSRRAHALAAATLLDMAHACRVRPSVDGEPVPPGRLVALDAAGPADPLTAPALAYVQKAPRRPGRAIKALGASTERLIAEHLERTGQIRRITERAGALRRRTRTSPTDRRRVGPARDAIMASLFERRPPIAPTAAIITVLHAVDGLGALLSLNDRGWRWVHARAGEIASGSWLDESPTGLADVNMAVTASAVRQALAGLT
ncbi:GPP34 family phosphoprotein [Mycolicibacterium sp. 018/SC-01/001]|uniref:GOLPH3/VPS74 family protein n=1 Tax=Mycolicibacterium sp. 018/SC-01/001 TaxID=2592069 RepID=UPI00117FDCC6|nr:GPP34 family phosphoprotein [Mycolicibacterium sp. 018/SC-01/001]TRW78392.1 GPP34 family phosphoprotein [Mycolicibacterium sp. 018/SC-01/001]